MKIQWKLSENSVKIQWFFDGFHVLKSVLIFPLQKLLQKHQKKHSKNRNTNPHKFNHSSFVHVPLGDRFLSYAWLNWRAASSNAPPKRGPIVSRPEHKDDTRSCSSGQWWQHALGCLSIHPLNSFQTHQNVRFFTLVAPIHMHNPLSHPPITFPARAVTIVLCAPATAGPWSAVSISTISMNRQAYSGRRRWNHNNETTPTNNENGMNFHMFCWIPFRTLTTKSKIFFENIWNWHSSIQQLTNSTPFKFSHKTLSNHFFSTVVTDWRHKRCWFANQTKLHQHH